MLGTPAIFTGDWQPGWLKAGAPVLNTTFRLRLVGAALERWRPVSGWSLEKGCVGPKPVRRLVPAGGVYFFEVAEGSAAALADRWLESICDDPQDRRDGFGLALWGVWDYHDHHPSQGA